MFPCDCLWSHEWTQDALCQWVYVLALSLGFCDTAQPCRLCLSWRSRVCWCPAALCSLCDFGEIVHALLCLSFLLKNGQASGRTGRTRQGGVCPPGELPLTPGLGPSTSLLSSLAQRSSSQCCLVGFDFYWRVVDLQCCFPVFLTTCISSHSPHICNHTHVIL